MHMRNSIYVIVYTWQYFIIYIQCHIVLFTPIVMFLNIQNIIKNKL